MHKADLTEQSSAARFRRQHPLRFWWQRATGLTLALAFCLCSSGCSLVQGVCNYVEYNDCTDDFVMSWRNCVWSYQAWHNRKAEFAGHAELGAFGEGFRDGYRDVASGGDGCPPPIPPRRYWSWKYQTPEGQCKVAAWYEGFSYGAKAAGEDGAGFYQQIQVSRAIELQYSPQFREGFLPGERELREEVLPGEPTDRELPPPNALDGIQTRFEPFDLSPVMPAAFLQEAVTPVTSWPDY